MHDPDARVRADRPPVLGAAIDAQTRCVHWRSELDVVAIRFRCCDSFYPCHACHEQSADHPVVRWPVHERDEAAVLCGVCSDVLSIETYLACGDLCPRCSAPFNPGCRTHRHLYFE